MKNESLSLRQCVVLNKEVVVFGSGKIGEMVIKFFSLSQHKVSCIIDNDNKKQGKRLKKIFIYSVAEGVQKYPNAVYVIANLKYSDNMKKQLLNLKIPQNNIIVCNDENSLRRQLNLLLPMKYENKYFIFDIPYERGGRVWIKYISYNVRALYYKLLMSIIHPRNIVTKKYQVSICAIFKNEAVYLQEWIEYHKLIGVQHFYLYNNFSKDNFSYILKPYIEKGEVTLIDWFYEQGQMSAYCDCVHKFQSESQWIGFIDLDEFIVPIDNTNLYDFLKKFEKHCGSVIIYWKFFGASGKVERDISGLVTEDFTVCWKKYTDIGKCFFNTAYEFIPEYKENGVLHHKMWTGYHGKVFPPVNSFGNVCFHGFDIAKEHFSIQINHYYTKSLSEWQEKMSKGDVYFKQNPHNEQRFYESELKCEDTDYSIYKYLVQLKKNMKK